MHEIKGEYGEEGCNVRIDGKLSKEPYLILNLEIYHNLKGIGGSHCDFIYIRRKETDSDSTFEIFVVELKNIRNIDKKIIRKNFQGKFPQTLRFLKERLTPFLGIDNTRRLKYYAVLALPQEIIQDIGSLIKRDMALFGELKHFDEAWIAACGHNILIRLMPIKKS